MRIVYYTSGVAGTGRIVQGISIGNALERKGIESNYTILSSSPFAYLADIFGIHHVEIPLEDDKALSRESCTASVLHRTLLELDPDVLIVDRLWFTLYNFINELRCRKIFFPSRSTIGFSRSSCLTKPLCSTMTSTIRC